MFKMCILVPAYNEERTIGNTIESILQYTDDIIVVNDGSKDRTRKIVEKYPVTLLNYSKNEGLAQTIKNGFEYMLYSGYDFAIKMDGDGQMRASKIPEFKEKILENPNVDLICATYDPDTIWMIRKDMAIYSFFYKLGTSIHTTDYLSEFRSYSRKAMKFILNTSDVGYSSPLVLMDMHRAGLSSMEIRGGVSYFLDKIRPFPIDGQLELRKAFVTKLYKFGTFRSRTVAISSMLFLLALMLFNVIVQPKYNSMLPKKYIR